MSYGRVIHAACFLFSTVLQLAPFVITYVGGEGVNQSHPHAPQYTYALYCICYGHLIVYELNSDEKDIVSLICSLVLGAAYLLYCSFYVLRRNVSKEVKLIGVIGLGSVILWIVVGQYDKILLLQLVEPLAAILEIVACICPLFSLFRADDRFIVTSEYRLRCFNVLVGVLWLMYYWVWGGGHDAPYWIVYVIEVVTDLIMILRSNHQPPVIRHMAVDAYDVELPGVGHVLDEGEDTDRDGRHAATNEVEDTDPPHVVDDSNGDDGNDTDEVEDTDPRVVDASDRGDRAMDEVDSDPRLVDDIDRHSADKVGKDIDRLAADETVMHIPADMVVDRAPAAGQTALPAATVDPTGAPPIPP